MDTPLPQALRSPRLVELGFRHGWLTRQGGVSDGRYASLNCSYSVGDVASHVTSNIALAAQFMGLKASQLYYASQVHGTTVRVVSPDTEAREVQREQADVIAARRGVLACCVRTADCLPILVADRSSGAVAAIHAGWRGIARGVIASGLSAVRALAGDKFSPVACIGPYIHAEAFEVSVDVAAELSAVAPDADAVIRTLGGKPHVDLGRLARAELCRGGVAAEDVEDLGECTFAAEEKFFSYRRDGQQSGRHLHFICPRIG